MDEDGDGEVSSSTPKFRAVKLSYTTEAPSAGNGGIMGTGARGVDLSPVRELVAEGWEVHTFSYDESGCWQEAIMVKCSNEDDSIEV